MANFDQKVTIHIDVDQKGVQSGIAAAAGELKSLEGAVDGLQNDLDGVTDSLTGIARAGDLMEDADIAPNLDIAGIEDELEAFSGLADSLETVAEKKDEVSSSNKVLNSRNRDTSISTDKEAESFQNLVQNATSLEEAKNAVSRANEKLTDRNEQTTQSALMESGALDHLNLSMVETADLAEDLTDQFREENESIRASRSSLRSLRKTTDNTTDSMRAAAEVGDLFEDGLGSLSVNLGAFTVALRNFLTQVPLLLTALGAAGAAALGAASGFIALAGAIGTVGIIGLIAQSQQLKEQFSQLKTLGKSFEVVMKNIKSTLMDAAKPLLENAQVIQFFRDTVQGLAFVINLLTAQVDELTESSGSAASAVFSISDAFSLIRSEIGPGLTEVINSLGNAFINLGEEIIVGSGNALTGLADAINRSIELFNEIDDLGSLIDQMGDSLSELAELGITIGGGLLPVFKAFSEIMETVAEMLNQIEDGIAQNAVTFLVLVAAMNKLGGVAGSLLTIFPNLVIGMGNIASAANGVSGAMATMRAATGAAATQLGGFLAQTNLFGGLTTLSTALTGTNERIRQIAFNSKAAEEMFEELAGEVDNTVEELQELAIQTKLTDEVLKSIDNEDVNIDIDVDRDSPIRAQRFLPDDPITRTMFGGIADEADETIGVIGRVKKRFGGLKNSIKSVVPSLVSFNIAQRIANTRIGGAIVRLAGQTASMLGLSSATLTATGSMYAFATSLAVATGGISVLLGVIGGLAVGIITNFEEIKSQSKDTFSTLKEAAKIVADFFIKYFIVSWNLMVDLFEATVASVSPLLDMFADLAKAFGLLGEEGTKSIDWMEVLRDVVNFLKGAVDVFAAAVRVGIDVLGGLLSITSVLIRVGLTPLIITLQLLGQLFDFILKKMFGVDRGAGKLTETLKQFFSTFVDAMQAIPGIVEDTVNAAIRLVNKFFAQMNRTTGVDLGQIEEVDFDARSEFKTDRDELLADTEGMQDSAKAEGDKTITYNEDNSTNIDQTIDADPEDQAQLSRVVTDAIAEANSFERRRQGGQ
jgi:methyl-accepting chemotaxis protein